MSEHNEETMFLSEMVETGSMMVEPVSQVMDLTDTTRFMKLDSEHSFGIQLSGLASQIPSVASSVSMNGMYTLRFPNGVTGALTQLKQGGYSTALKGPNGQFSGTASLFKASMFSAVFGAISVMAVVSGQYFLSQINSELKVINQKIDKILVFLYGDKKAELLSEICFIKRAIRDYTSVMGHDSQITATLISIQQSEKVAMKDIEFYLQDLLNTVKTELKGSAEVNNTVDVSLQICESLNASLQLYIMSCILEVYYSQNTDKKFVQFLKEDLSLFVEKCNNRITACISQVKGKVESYTARIDKVDKEPILKRLTDVTDALQEEKTAELKKSISAALDAISKEVTFIVSNGEVYYKTA